MFMKEKWRLKRTTVSAEFSNDKFWYESLKGLKRSWKHKDANNTTQIAIVWNGEVRGMKESENAISIRRIRNNTSK